MSNDKKESLKEIIVEDITTRFHIVLNEEDDINDLFYKFSQMKPTNQDYDELYDTIIEKIGDLIDEKRKRME
jgi:hypothetical protein